MNADGIGWVWFSFVAGSGPESGVPGSGWFWLLMFCIACAALLYSSVGHAGASGYIAVLTLFSLPAAEIRPAALALNILVSVAAVWNFVGAGHFCWRLWWPFAAASIPMAWLGGKLSLPVGLFQILLGVVLIASAGWLLFQPRGQEETLRPPPLWKGLLAGAVLGMLAGITGTGGGIFLTPLILWNRWAPMRIAAGVSALFILVNSVSGLAGRLSEDPTLPGWLWPLMASAIAGGIAGSYAGSRKLPVVAVKRILAVVLLVASTKLLGGW